MKPKVNLKVHSRRLFALAALLSLLLATIPPANAQYGAVEDQYDGEDTGGGGITVTGTISEYGTTTFQYGTHGIVEDETMVEYALTSESINLGEYDGERVTVSGTFVPGFESGQVENGPPLVEVSDVQPADGGGPGSMDITGTVLEADGDSVLVEDGSGGQYALAITEDTGFVDGLSYIPEEAPPRNPNASDLEPGLTVQVSTTGPVAESFPAQGEAGSIVFLSDWYEEGGESVKKTLSGYVTDLADGSVTVSEDPSLTIEDPGYCNTTIQFSIEETTEIYTTENGQTVPASAKDLARNQSLEVTYTEEPGAVYPAVCPTQRTADSITILEKSGDDDDDGGNSGESGGGDEGDSSSPTLENPDGEVASDSYEVLPDTGGLGIPSLAAGASVVAAGACLLVGNRSAKKS